MCFVFSRYPVGGGTYESSINTVRVVRVPTDLTALGLCRDHPRGPAVRPRDHLPLLSLQPLLDPAADVEAAVAFCFAILPLTSVILTLGVEHWTEIPFPHPHRLFDVPDMWAGRYVRGRS